MSMSLDTTKTILLASILALASGACREEQKTFVASTSSAPVNASSTSSSTSSDASVENAREVNASRPTHPEIPEDTEWSGDGDVRFSQPVVLLKEGGVVLERQLWTFGDFDGVAWRVRAPRATPIRVVPTNDLQKIEDLVSSPSRGAWATINGGFYERWPNGSHPYRAMGVVQSQGKEHSPYRHRGGSGVLVVDAKESSPQILHRDAYKKRGGDPPWQALQSIDRIVSGGETLVKKREGAKMAARSAVALTEKEVILITLAARTSVREFDGGARLFKTSFLGLPLWAFAAYVRDSTGAQEALNMDGAVSTQMMVRLDGEVFKLIGERGIINAVELRVR